MPPETQYCRFNGEAFVVWELANLTECSIRMPRWNRYRDRTLRPGGDSQPVSIVWRAWLR